VLKKKSNSIAYHAVREAVAMKEILISYINTDLNVADILTKVLPAGDKRTFLVQQLLWDITHDNSKEDQAEGGKK
jgi:hypothetical protein